MPESTLKAFADHGKVGDPTPLDGRDTDAELATFASAKVDVGALAKQLQEDGAKSFVKSWHDLMDVISSKSAALNRAS
jgi:transaldolase